MSTPIFSVDSGTARTCTVVRVKRARIRRLAPGTGCLEKNGKTLRINHDGPEAAGVRLGAIERAFYAVNLKMVGWRHDPAAAFFQVVHSAKALKGTMKNAGPAARATMRMAPRAIAVAVISLLALAGVTRFVHVDLRAALSSVHFGMPHFLTPWREETTPKAVGTPVVIGTQSPQYPTAIAANGAPEQPLAQQGLPGQGAADGSAPGAYVPQYYRANKDSYLPLPSDGPLPAGMSATYAHAGTQVPGVAALTVHEPFTEPEEAPADGVALMAPAAVSPAAPAVQLLGSTTEAKPTPKSEPKVEVERKAETRSARTGKEKAPVSLEVHAANERKDAAVRPSQQAHLANALSQSQMAVAPVVIPSQDQAPAQQSATSDLVLLKQPAAQTSTPSDDGQDDDAIPLQVHQAARRQAEEQEQPSGPHHPSFRVVTHTDDSLVVNVDGQMKQIPVGKTLPDGSKLLGVSHDGGGFTTNRGDYSAY